MLLGGFQFGGDVGQLCGVFAIGGLHALVEAGVVVLEQVFGGAAAVGGAFQGLDVVFHRVARVVVGLFGGVYAGRNQGQGQEDRFHCIALY